MMIYSILMAMAAPQTQAAQEAAPAEKCNAPVYMVVAGETHDRTRMQAYARAIAESGLYQKLGGYYVNSPFALATFDGAPPDNHVTLIVRFPCFANAKAFWYSKEYQENIKPIRTTPPVAGDYTVTIYPEIPVRSDLAGKVGDNGYRIGFDASSIEQTSP